MLSQKRIGSLLASALACSAAFAGDPTVADRVNEISAQIEILKKEGELRDALARVAGATGSSLPKVLSIMSFDGVRTATLVHRGFRSTLKEGDVFRVGMRVAAITERDVVMAVSGVKGKKVVLVPLEFAIGNEALPGGASAMPMGSPASIVPPELLPAPPRVRIGPGAALPRAPEAPAAGSKGGAGGPPGAQSGQPAGATSPSGQKPASQV